MELGMVGLGRMGSSMVQRLLLGGHRLIVYDRISEAIEILVEQGAVGAASIAGLVQALEPPRAVWVMVPAGAPTESVIQELGSMMTAGDIIIDGGNSYYQDSIRRSALLSKKGIDLLDTGTSGGLWGLEHGYCLMVGGELRAFQRLEPVFQTLAPGINEGYGYVGRSGAGHFVKMVHNGIEYGLMQSYAEGFELMAVKPGFDLDLLKIARTWRHGSIIRSWLLDLLAGALEEDPGLVSLDSFVEDSGEGRWMVREGLELAIPLPSITAALNTRFRSRQTQPFSGRLLAALRKKFGGHPVRPVRK